MATAQSSRLAWIMLLVAVLLFSAADSKRFHSFAGPFRIIFKRVMTCSNVQNASKDMFNLYIHDFRSRDWQFVRVSGNVSIPFVVDDNLEALVVLASWSNVSGWRENAFHFRFKKLCYAMELMGTTLWYDLQVSCCSVATGCPLLPGIYRWENVTVDMAKLPFRNFIYGRWRADCRMITKQGEVSGCVRAIIETLPRA